MRKLLIAITLSITCLGTAEAQRYIPIQDTFFVLGSDIGAYADGDTIMPGENLVTVVSNMLRTRILPTYSQPTAGLDDGESSVQEVGNQLNPVSLTGSWSQNDAGDYNSLEFARDGSTIGSGSFAYTDNDALYSSTSTVVYEFEVCYDEGPTKDDNLGDPYPTGKVLAGCVDAETSVTGIYPFLWGVDASDLSGGGTAAYTSLDKHVHGKGDKDVVWDVASNVYMYFCYPSSYGELSEIIDNNGFDVTDAFDVYTVGVGSSGQDKEWSVSYKIYKLKTLTNTSAVTYHFNF